MVDFSKYRLNDDAELDKFRTDPVRFLQFQKMVYTILDRMDPNSQIKVLDIVKENSVEVFIKVVCSYINMEARNRTFEDSYIEFSDDYRTIHRREGFKMPHRVRHFYSEKR